ncbi:MAG: mscL [Candidatus Saccharibacteria bacterium]|nr:mscL [Candidatus Saccharibacteria bacterium]
MIKDFKKFILRGNTIDLAVAVVIGAAFGAIVTALVKDLITPLVGAIGGQPDFSASYFTINDSKFMYGDFINAVIAFLIVAAVVFFLIVQPVNKLIARGSRNKQPDDPTTKKCPECLSVVPIKATRCAFCTSKLS